MTVAYVIETWEDGTQVGLSTYGNEKDARHAMEYEAYAHRHKKNRHKRTVLVLKRISPPKRTLREVVVEPTY